MAISLTTFKAIQNMVYAEAGIFFSDNKMYFVDTRLQSRFQAVNCSDEKEYLDFLKMDRAKVELDKLIDSLTTNETYFFRDKFQLDAFIDEMVPAIIQRKMDSGDANLKIWSAGCSTGEEPYTLAMLLKEKISNLSQFNLQLLATDISDRVLGGCRAAVYPERSLKDTPAYYRDKYFVRDENLWRVQPEIKKMVQFSRMNLFNKGMMHTIKNVDVIFCRNVLVYFDKASAKQVIGCFYDSLNSGGSVILGFSESMHQFSAAFKMIKYKAAFGYMKE